MSRSPSVQAVPDLTGFSPPTEAFHAYDTDTYDGAPDAGSQIVGTGATAEDALADYDIKLASIDDDALAERAYNRSMVRSLVEGIRAPDWHKGDPEQAKRTNRSLRQMIRAHRRHHTMLIKLENRT